MRIAALQILQLRLHHSRQRIAQPGDGQRQQHLVRVQPGIMVAQILDLGLADGRDDRRGDQLQLMVDARQILQRVQQQRRGSTDEVFPVTTVPSGSVRAPDTVPVSSAFFRLATTAGHCSGDT